MLPDHCIPKMRLSYNKKLTIIAFTTTLGFALGIPIGMGILPIAFIAIPALLIAVPIILLFVNEKEWIFR